MNVENNYCLICNSPAIETIPHEKARNSLFKGLNFNICTKCEVAWIREYIPQDSLNQYYREEYGDWRKKDLPPKDFFNDHRNLFKPQRSRSQFNLLSTYLEEVPQKIFDFGAGLGTTPFIAKTEYCPGAELYAIEPDNYVRRYLEFLHVKIYDNLDAIPPESFDLIIASHVLEHFNLSDLPNIIESLHSILKYNGLLLVEVPNENFVRFPKNKLRPHEPHLIFFSLDSISKLFRDAGYKVIFSKTVGRPIKKSVYWFWSKIVNLMAKMFGIDRRLVYGNNYKCIRLVLKKILKKNRSLLKEN